MHYSRLLKLADLSVLVAVLWRPSQRWIAALGALALPSALVVTRLQQKADGSLAGRLERKGS